MFKVKTQQQQVDVNYEAPGELAPLTPEVVELVEANLEVNNLAPEVVDLAEKAERRKLMRNYLIHHWVLVPLTCVSLGFTFGSMVDHFTGNTVKLPMIGSEQVK